MFRDEYTEEFKRRCYELYQLDWIKEHGYSLYDFMNEIAENVYDGLNIVEAFDEFEMNGIDGDLFACEEEFLENEFLDVEYMEYLIHNDKAMWNKYLSLMSEEE